MCGDILSDRSLPLTLYKNIHIQDQGYVCTIATVSFLTSPLDGVTCLVSFV